MPTVLRVLLAAALLANAGVEALPQEALRRDARTAPARTPEQALAKEHHRKGRELMRSEKYPEAIEELREAVRLDPDLIMAHYDLGQSYMAVREYATAVNAYGACREAWVKFADALQRGDFEADAMREDRIRELRDQLRELQRIPATPGTSQYAQIQAEMARIENLIQSLDMNQTRGIQRLELPGELSLALGSAYFRSGQLDEAEKAYQAAVTVQPKLGQAHNNLAVVYLMTKRPADAKEAVKRAEKAGFKVSSELKKDIDAAVKTEKP
jgi:Flp pilus assembly protein TadD